MIPSAHKLGLVPTSLHTVTILLFTAILRGDYYRVRCRNEETEVHGS